MKIRVGSIKVIRRYFDGILPRREPSIVDDPVNVVSTERSNLHIQPISQAVDKGARRIKFA